MENISGFFFGKNFQSFFIGLRQTFKQTSLCQLKPFPLLPNLNYSLVKNEANQVGENYLSDLN